MTLDNYNIDSIRLGLEVISSITGALGIVQEVIKEEDNSKKKWVSAYDTTP